MNFISEKYDQQSVLHNRLIPLAMGVVLLFALIGCESQPTEVEDYTNEPILTAFLYNGEPVDTVYFERVAPVYGYYDPAEYGIPGADIIICPVADPLTEFRFTDPDSDGVYTPDGNVLVPESGVQYSIEARKDDEGLFLWAETIVPDTFSLAMTPEPIDTIDNYPILDTLTRNDPNIVLDWTDSGTYAGYVLNVICEDDSFIPLDPDYEPDDDEDSSRVAFDVVLEGTNTKTIPWIYFEWAGWHRIELLAVDEAYFDYFISVFRLQFGQVTSLDYNVQGGLGIFAGVSKRDFKVYMEPIE